MAGLSAGAARWCMVASLIVASAAGASAAVASAASLPDGRAFELVSPPDKNGADVRADSQRVRVADDGSAVVFASISGFGDVHGTSYASDYMAVRTPNGWATHGIMPPQSPLPLQGLAIDPLYQGPLSPDLSQGVFQAWSSLTDDPYVKDALNLYVRSDLRSPGIGSYELLTGCPLCADNVTPLPPPVIYAISQQPRLAGTAADMGHAIFESALKLTPDSPGNCTDPNDQVACPVKLYESDHGVVRLAGILSNGTPAPRSIAGEGAVMSHYTPHTISADGRKIFFTVPSAPSDRFGKLYMRYDNGQPDAATVALNVSERTDCADHDPCTGTPEPDPGGVKPATYADASVNGSRVFFTSTERLTDDAGSGVKLYMYDTTKPADDPHNLTVLNVDHQPADGNNDADGVIGVGDNGHFVYFTATGQLVATEPASGPGTNVYVWHDDGASPEVDFIANLPNPNDVSEALTGQEWTVQQQMARVSPDGRHLLFSATNPGPGPMGYDQGHCNHSNVGLGCREFYWYEESSKALRCVSLACNGSGATPVSDAEDAIRTNVGALNTTWALTRPMSDDGGRVFFATADALVPQDVNGKYDVYEYVPAENAVHLISSGVDPSDSYFMGASASGNDVFFLTRAKLVGWDTDNNYDLYDARVGGGFPEPPPADSGCSGEVGGGGGCGAPAAVSPASLFVHGRGNVAPVKAVACRRGFVRKRVKGKVRCVRQTPPHCRPGFVHKRVKGGVRCVKRRSSAASVRKPSQRGAK